MMTDNEYNILLENSQPHQVFKLNWSSYYLSEFSDTFLPKAYVQNLKGINLKDVANIFENIPKSNEQLTVSDQKIKLSIFTYPKDALIAKKKDLLKTSTEDLVVFIETDKNDNLTIFSKLNSSLKKLLLKDANTVLKDKQLSKTQFLKELNYEVNLLNLIEFIIGNHLNKANLANLASLRELQQTFKELEEEFGAGRVKDKHPNAFAHGDIEDIALKNAGFSTDEIDQVYYGNWLRDYSQVITADTVGFNRYDQNIFRKILVGNPRVEELLPMMSCKPSQDTWVQLVKLLAIKEFIYNPKKKEGKVLSQNFEVHEKDFEKKFGQLSKDILGVYRPEEHLDNPKDLQDDTVFADPRLQNPIQSNYEFDKNKTKIKTLYAGENELSLHIDNESLMKRFLVEDIKVKDKDNRPSSLTYLKQQLILAKKKGKNKEGLRHFGAALHVIEDYFAHTNFIELALIKNGYTKVFPWVQMDTDIESMTNGKEKASQIPIVSGLFGSDDTIASITPKIAEELFPLGFQEYQSIKENERTFFDNLVTTLLEDLASKEQAETTNACFPIKVPSWLNLSYKELLTIYNNYLDYRDWWAKQKENKYYGFIVRAISIGLHYFSQTLTFFSDTMFNILLNSIEDGIKEKQSRVNQNFGTNPTHTQIAKDPPDHPLNNLAGTLAIMAVTDITKKMKSTWFGGLKIDYLITHIEKNYFTHPKNVTWVDKTVKDWASKNKEAVQLAEDKTAVYHHEKQIKKTFKKYESEIETLKTPPKQQ